MRDTTSLGDLNKSSWVWPSALQPLHMREEAFVSREREYQISKKKKKKKKTIAVIMGY